jgi:hypothetical protein
MNCCSLLYWQHESALEPEKNSFVLQRNWKAAICTEAELEQELVTKALSNKHNLQIQAEFLDQAFRLRVLKSEDKYEKK